MTWALEGGLSSAPEGAITENGRWCHGFGSGPTGVGQKLDITCNISLWMFWMLNSAHLPFPLTAYVSIGNLLDLLQLIGASHGII